MKTEITIHTNTQKKTNSEVNVLKCTDISPQKYRFFIFWAILAVILFLIRYAVNLIEKLIPFSVNYILMPMWIIAALFCLLVLPFYFIRSYFTVSSTRSHRLYRAFSLPCGIFMPTSAIKSVTTIITPPGQYNRT